MAVSTFFQLVCCVSMVPTTTSVRDSAGPRGGPRGEESSIDFDQHQFSGLGRGTGIPSWSQPISGTVLNFDHVFRESLVQHDYWEESTRPLNSLLLVAPLLLLYEWGMLWLGADSPRNGADMWLRDALEAMGLTRYFFLPCMTCGILLGWHHLSRKAWRIDADIVSGMICESILLGISLVVFARVYASLLGNTLSVASNSVALAPAERVPLILGYLGAGIYEELLFRLILLSGLVAVARHCGADLTSAIVLGVVSTSLLFAAAHYQLFFEVGGAFSWYSFVFRLTAGGLFCILFLKRGFGIAVGTHAAYDLLVASLA